MKQGDYITIFNLCRTEKISQTIIRVGMIITVGLGLERLDKNDPVDHQRTLLLQVVVVEQEYRAEDDQLVYILHHIPRALPICQITPPGVEYNCQPGRQLTVAF